MAKRHAKPVKINTVPCPSCGQVNEYSATPSCKNTVGCNIRATRKTVNPATGERWTMKEISGRGF